MSKKDYIKFSKMFSKVGNTEGVDKNTYLYILDEVIKIFKEDNVNFSGAAFYTAILTEKDNG
jgi:hypothetical protein